MPAPWQSDDLARELAYAIDGALWARNVLELDLDDWQQDLIRAHGAQLVLCSRQRPGVNVCLRKIALYSGDIAKLAAMRKISPSRVKRPPRSAPHNRTAVSHIVSSTGCRSKVERLITWSTSLVAVWYSSDSFKTSAVATSRASASSRSLVRSSSLCCNSALARRSSATWCSSVAVMCLFRSLPVPTG